MKTTFSLIVVGLVAAGLATMIVGGELPARSQSAATATSIDYQPIGAGIRWLVKPDAFVKTLVERQNYGNGDVEIAELHLPKVSKSAQVVQGLEHTHKSTEIFYVISGRLGHTVNGQKHVIEPGQVGIVHAGDKIIHTVEGDEPVKAIVVWVPGGEVDNMLYNLGFDEQPIGGLLAD